jgi:hypothetical protein
MWVELVMRLPEGCNGRAPSVSLAKIAPWKNHSEAGFCNTRGLLAVSVADGFQSIQQKKIIHAAKLNIGLRRFLNAGNLGDLGKP